MLANCDHKCKGGLHLIIREHQEAEANLTAEDETTLRREFDGRLDVTPSLLDQTCILKTTQHVGFIALPSGRLIEIRPKVRIDVLFGMLAKIHGLANFYPQDVRYTSVMDIFEFVVSLFVQMVDSLVIQGILLGYQSMNDDLLALRGKVLLTETVRAHPVVRSHHWCEFSEFTADIPENRILKMACMILMAYNYRRIPDLIPRLRRLCRVFVDVTISEKTIENSINIVFNRLNEHYRPALRLARLLLDHLSPSGAYGSNQFLAFLVNMDTLFEKYITTVLEEMSIEGVTVIAQDTLSLDLEGTIGVRPDVVFYRGAEACLALDAKYKRGEQNADVYQALAYGHALDMKRVVLVYPKTETVGHARHRIRPIGDIEVVVIPLDLTGGIDELKRHSYLFAERVASEIGPL